MAGGRQPLVISDQSSVWRLSLINLILKSIVSLLMLTPMPGGPESHPRNARAPARKKQFTVG